MKQRKVSTDELLQYSQKHFKVLHKFRKISGQLDDFLYPFVSPKELNVIGKVLTKINKHLELEKLEEELIDE